MRKLITVLLCAFALLSIATAQKNTPQVTGAMGFKLGMTKESAEKLIQNKGWSDIQRSSYHWSKFFLDEMFLFYYMPVLNVSLMWSRDRLATIAISSHLMEYDPDRTLADYSNSVLLNILEKKYGIPYIGDTPKRIKGYKNLTIPPTDDECFSPKRQVRLIWPSNEAKVQISYVRQRDQIYLVLIYLHYELSDEWDNSSMSEL